MTPGAAVAATRLSITTASLPHALVGTAYSATVRSIGGRAPRTFTARITDATHNAATRAFAIKIDPFTIRPATLPAGLAGAPYPVTTLTATGGRLPLTWTISAGALPSGLTLSSGGILSGVPTAAGSFAFTVQTVDASTPRAQLFVDNGFTAI